MEASLSLAYYGLFGSLTRTKAKSSAGFETISNLESEEEHIGSSSPQNSEDYIESDDDRADSYTADEPFEEQIDLVNTGLSDIDYLDSAVRAEATPTVEQASQAYARLLG